MPQLKICRENQNHFILIKFVSEKCHLWANVGKSGISRQAALDNMNEAEKMHSACRITKATTHKLLIFNTKSKWVPLQACSGPEGSKKLRFPDFMTTAQDGG